MPVAYPSRDSRRPPLPDTVVLAVAALLVLAGATGLIPPLAAVALAGAAGSVLASIRLSWLAAVRTGPTRTGPAAPGRVADGLAAAGSATAGSATIGSETIGRETAGGWTADRVGRRVALRRRAAAMLDAAVVAAGLTAAVLPLTGAPRRVAVAAVGLAVASVLHAGGLLLGPGRSRLPSRVLLRRVVDAVSLGISLIFATWMLLPAGEVPMPARTALMAGAGGLAAIVVTAQADWRRRPGAAICRTGAAATLLGLIGLVVLLAYRAPESAVLAIVPPLVAGALLTAAGARRVAGDDPPRPGGPPPTWPRVTAPAGIAMLAACWHLWAVGEFDPAAILLGLAVIPPLLVRELLSAADNRRYADRLAAQEAHFRALVSGGHDLILLLDPTLRVRWQSPAATRLFGLTDADVLARPLVDLLHPEDAPRAAALLDEVRAGRRPSLLVARLRDGHGTWRETESTISDQRGVPEVDALVLHVRDVGERRRLERTVHQLAATDLLTGLANRRELLRALGARRDPPDSSGALLLVDLHGLGAVNDGGGQAAGEAVLVEVARRMRALAGPQDLLARLTGDEFVVATDAGPVLAYALGTQLLARLTEPYQLDGSVVSLRVSIGLAETGGSGPDDVLRQADLARRRAVQLGRDRIEWYDAYLEEQLVRRLDLERELPGAVARGELDLVYQPVLGLTDRSPAGTEALLRWRSPVLGTVLPAELLPVAEDLGLVGELGQWVLDRACRQLVGWSAGSRQLWMAVNVTPRELIAPDFVQRVAAVLAEHDVPADRLVVEVAEPRIGPDLPTVVARLAGLRSLGVRTALDDFRAEHASLARLRRLPIDLLKVGPHLVGADDNSDRPLIDVVVSLGDRLGLEIVVEELESAAQVDRAWRAGCRYGQGFALARPATAERVEAYFEQFPTTSR